MVKRVCQHCGKEYETFPSIRLQFCSMKCANNAKRRQKATITCATCGKERTVFPSQADQKYCSRSCAITARNLTDQNPSYKRDVSGDKNPMYGKGMKGAANPMYGKRAEKSPRWKGGRKVRKDGYTLVIAPPDHPYPSDSSHDSVKYILEHRLVMEQHLGRYLLPTEVVHHIDGNPRNNDISNLRLYSSQSEHIATEHPNVRAERRLRPHIGSQSPSAPARRLRRSTP